jgi:hypothetical protein
LHCFLSAQLQPAYTYEGYENYQESALIQAVPTQIMFDEPPVNQGLELAVDANGLMPAFDQVKNSSSFSVLCTF